MEDYPTDCKWASISRSWLMISRYLSYWYVGWNGSVHSNQLQNATNSWADQHLSGQTRPSIVGIDIHWFGSPASLRAWSCLVQASAMQIELLMEPSVFDRQNIGAWLCFPNKFGHVKKSSKKASQQLTGPKKWNGWPQKAPSCPRAGRKKYRGRN